MATFWTVVSGQDCSDSIPLKGNRTRRTKNSDSSYEEYTFDFRNRLIKVDFKTSGGTVTKWIEYAYDPFNRLVRRTIDPDGSRGAAATDQFFAGYDEIHATLEFDNHRAKLRHACPFSRFWGTSC